MVRLADVTGVVAEVPAAGLLADPSLELVTGSRVPMARRGLERLPAEAAEPARWWERHIIEVITGVPPGARRAPGPAPSTTRPAALRQRELAKDGELALPAAPGRAEHGAAAAASVRERRAWGLVDHRAARRRLRPAPTPGWWRRSARPSARRRTGRPARSTGCGAGWSRSWPPSTASTRPVMPARATFYRLAARAGLGEAHLRLGAAPAGRWRSARTGRSAR